VTTDFPLQSCIAAQYAGWPFGHGDYFAMCSGPARVCRGKETILEENQLVHSSRAAVGVFEASAIPPSDALDFFSVDCRVEPDGVTICVARTNSLPGAIQVVARSVETAMHKLHELGVDLRQVRSAVGTAPLPPVARCHLQAMGWTNDAVLYGGHVTMWVNGNGIDWSAIASELPSVGSADFGTPFRSIFESYNRDFYKIDPRLFSPARVTIHEVDSGATYVAGTIRTDILHASFGIPE
jgi:methenyltetrahydromethanopterin cyclohydrolase